MIAQNENPPQATSKKALTVNVRLVTLDVVATDKAGNPVDNLSQSDFQVMEEGKLQRIRSFEPPGQHALPADVLAADSTTVFDPAKPASFGQSPATILVLDQLNTHFADSSFARRALNEYLRKQPETLAQPATLLMLYDENFKQLQPFTRDRNLLLKALNTAPTKYAWKLEVNGKADHGPLDRLDQSLRALEEMAESYAAIPGRKNLIWVGGGFPSINPESLDTPDARDVSDTLKHVTNLLIDTRITMYAVDPTSNASGMTEITDASQMTLVNAGADASAGTGDPFVASDDFDSLGPVTGGRVIRGRNDIANLIKSSVDLGSHFYTLTYSPTSASEEAVRFRKIEIVCLRPGLTATTRTGYYSGQTEQDKSAATAAYDLLTAAEGPMPLNGLHVTATRDESAGASAGSFILHVGAGNLTWQSRTDGRATASVTVMAVSLDKKNKMIGHKLQGMIATAKPGIDLHAGTTLADFAFTAPPAPKSTTQRFVVRDKATGRMGSVDLPVKP